LDVLLAPVKLLMRLENQVCDRFIPLCVLQNTNKNNIPKVSAGRHLDFRADYDAVDVALHEELRRG